MKNKWSNYALKDGKVQSSYIREYCNRKKVRKARKTSDCDSIQQSGKEQAKEEVKLVYKEPTHYRCDVNPQILNDAWVINLRSKDESSRKENIVETHQQGQQGIQATVEGRSSVKEENLIKTKGEEMKKEKESAKAHKKHEAKESKAYEKKEDRKEAKKESKAKK